MSAPFENLEVSERIAINGATGSAGRLAVQLAKYLGAGKVIATGRHEDELQIVVFANRRSDPLSR